MYGMFMAEIEEGFSSKRLCLILFVGVKNGEQEFMKGIGDRGCILFFRINCNEMGDVIRYYWLN